MVPAYGAELALEGATCGASSPGRCADRHSQDIRFYIADLITARELTSRYARLHVPEDVARVMKSPHPKSANGSQAVR